MNSLHSVILRLGEESSTMPAHGRAAGFFAALRMTGLTRRLVISAVLAICCAATAAETAKRPNIIFILADDLGWGDLSCYGNTFLATPNLDRLARGGALFTQFYVNGSVCSPSRSAFFTSMFPARNRIHGHFATPEQNTARGM